MLCTKFDIKQVSNIQLYNFSNIYGRLH